MPMIEIAQAVRNAIEVELGAARFYQQLARRGVDERVRDFLTEMAREEEQHAAAVTAMGKRLHDGELPQRADAFCSTVETVPGWEEVVEIDLAQALNLALEAEQHAALYYGALADSVTAGPLHELFSTMSRAEEQHVKRLEEFLLRAGAER